MAAAELGRQLALHRRGPIRGATTWSMAATGASRRQSGGAVAAAVAVRADETTGIGIGGGMTTTVDGIVAR